MMPDKIVAYRWVQRTPDDPYDRNCWVEGGGLPDAEPFKSLDQSLYIRADSTRRAALADALATVWPYVCHVEAYDTAVEDVLKYLRGTMP